MWALCIVGDLLFSGSSDNTIKVTACTFSIAVMLLFTEPFYRFGTQEQVSSVFRHF